MADDADQALRITDPEFDQHGKKRDCGPHGVLGRSG
jgi:hypothetical protein